MYGQMTAGSWIYIGTQGILQGTFETFAELARQHFGGSLAGRDRPDRRPRRHGRRPAARGHDERRRVRSRSRSIEARAVRRLEIGYVDRLTGRLDEALAMGPRGGGGAGPDVDRARRQRG